jgi:ABC-type hemin transport system substrate-binding protein
MIGGRLLKLIQRGEKQVFNPITIQILGTNNASLIENVPPLGLEALIPATPKVFAEVVMSIEDEEA